MYIYLPSGWPCGPLRDLDPCLMWNTLPESHMLSRPPSAAKRTHLLGTC